MNEYVHMDIYVYKIERDCNRGSGVLISKNTWYMCVEEKI